MTHDNGWYKAMHEKREVIKKILEVARCSKNDSRGHWRVSLLEQRLSIILVFVFGGCTERFRLGI
jgi:hypothetical protein